MYTVTWTQSASDQLADIWIKADSHLRNEITKYLHDLDRHLRANADRLGESRETGVRILTSAPVGIEFLISEPDRLVTVVRAWGLRFEN
jgi:hypothetical protein